MMCFIDLSHNTLVCKIVKNPCFTPPVLLKYLNKQLEYSEY